MVELLLDDLLDWSDWTARTRLSAKHLVVLGGSSMQCARYESGQDDSPMYDGRGANLKSPHNPRGDLGGDFFSPPTTKGGAGLMEMADCGQTSLAAQEAYALADLAALVGKPAALVAALQRRGDTLVQAIEQHLWDPALQIFTNQFTANSSLYPRITPTSFYPLAVGAASAAQADVMMSRWFANTSHFAVTGELRGNPAAVHFGLPSVERSDRAFPVGYWRGNVWGPHAQLTYWSLQQHDHVSAVATARKALAKQMDALLLSQWNANRHICENYSPSLGAPLSFGDCTGTHFYHWGALTGVIGLMEDGLW